MVLKKNPGQLTLPIDRAHEQTWEGMGDMLFGVNTLNFAMLFLIALGGSTREASVTAHTGRAALSGDAMAASEADVVVRLICDRPPQ